MLSVRDLVTEFSVDSDIALVTALVQSVLKPAVTDAIGPTSWKPAVILIETPVVVERVVDFSFVIESEAVTDIDGDRLHDSPPLQASVFPSICCGPDLV